MAPLAGTWFPIAMGLGWVTVPPQWLDARSGRGERGKDALSVLVGSKRRSAFDRSALLSVPARCPALQPGILVPGEDGINGSLDAVVRLQHKEVSVARQSSESTSPNQSFCSHASLPTQSLRGTRSLGTLVSSMMGMKASLGSVVLATPEVASYLTSGRYSFINRLTKY